MKGLKNFRKDHDISAWYLARFAGISTNDYLLYERTKDEDIPDRIKSKLTSIMEHGGFIDDFHIKCEKFYNENDLKEVFSDLSYDNIAENIGTGIGVIKDILENDQPFPDIETRDKLLDFAIWTKEHKELRNVESNNVSPEEIQFPELPSMETKETEESTDKDQFIQDLYQQLDWYEDLLTGFAYLVKIAYKNNK